jgi:hypothetical protein
MTNEKVISYLIYFLNMSNFDDIEIPVYEKFCEGYKKYEEYAGRDPFYQVATTYLLDHWGSFEHMADAVGILLLNWNKMFYRFGSLDLEKLEKCITNNFVTINSFKDRDISTFSENDEQNIRKLFNDFLEASMIDSEKKKAKSPVSVAKALHLLAPRFFPPWDNSIAYGYKQDYSYRPEEKYIRFCKITKFIAESMKDYDIDRDKNLIKLIDEYNFAKYTKKLIE